MLGSTYYVDHPVVPLYQTKANINIDGLAMFGRFRSIMGFGTELSTLGSILETVANRMSLQLEPIPLNMLASESFARSDQVAFAKAGIPAMLISDGLSYQHISTEQAHQLWQHWMTHIYHTPFDDLNQPINFEAARQHVQVIAAMTESLVTDHEWPEWIAGTPYRVTRLLSIAEKR